MSSSFRLDPQNSILKRLGLNDGGKVQRYIDTTVLRLSEPYTPFDTGIMSKSGSLHTVIGTGEVIWRTPYVRRQYYLGRGQGGSIHGMLRGRLWFDRMKADRGDEIIKGAKAITNKGGRE